MSARFRKELEARERLGFSNAIEAVRASLRDWPDAGCDEGIAKEVERLLASKDVELTEAKRKAAGLEAALGSVCKIFRKRIHLLEQHNQTFERCESGWCNPSETRTFSDCDDPAGLHAFLRDHGGALAEHDAVRDVKLAQTQRRAAGMEAGLRKVMERLRLYDSTGALTAASNAILGLRPNITPPKGLTK